MARAAEVVAGLRAAAPGLAIGHAETGPALDGLSDALFWLEECEASLHHRSRAFAWYREAGDLCRAARAALWLAMGYISALGNAPAANGWLHLLRLDPESGVVEPWSPGAWRENAAAATRAAVLNGA